MSKLNKQKITLLTAILWSIFLLALQLILYSHYESKQSRILGVIEQIKTCLPIVGLFGIGEFIAVCILSKEKFIKFNAIYSFTIVIVFTIGAAILSSLIFKSFHLLYFLSYLVKENGMSHVPPYTFFSMVFVSLCVLLSLSIPQRYFGRLEYSHKKMGALLLYFLLISIHL